MRRVLLCLPLLLTLSAASPVLAASPEVSAGPASVKEVAQTTAALNATTLRLHQQLATERKGLNVVSSPLSVGFAMGMVQAGATGQTLEELRAVFGHTLPEPRVHAAMGAIHKELLAPKNASYTLKLANRLWPGKGALVPTFQALMAREYRAPAQTLDYNKPEQARKTINRWVAAQTNQLIKDLIPKGVITPRTLLVLTNAIHFKGMWKQPFDRKLTTKGAFKVSASKTVQAQMMRRPELVARFSSTPQMSLIALPFRGEQLELVLLIPEQASSVDRLMSDLTPAGLQRALDALQQTTLDVTLPRFKFSTQAALIKPLTAMGVRRVFSQGAELGGMTRVPSHVSAVIHQATVEVNEQGAEAAAATAVVDVKDTFAMPPRHVVDRPFAFLIRDRTTGAILFIGAVHDPTAS